MADEEDLARLVELVRNSFRVHPNNDPVYVDIGGYESRIFAPQHQVIFGRRGSGKSCLLVHCHRAAASRDIGSIYLNADEHKMLLFPDLLVRLLIEVLRALPQRRRFARWRPTMAALEADRLGELLDEAVSADASRVKTRKDTESSSISVEAGSMAAILGADSESSVANTVTFRQKKIDYLERHLTDFKQAIEAAHFGRKTHTCLIIDDFYQIHTSVQPDVIDFLHRLTRGTSIYLKVGTIRHRTRLSRRHGQTVGIERSEDVEFIELDRGLTNVEETAAYLTRMLDSMAAGIGIDDASERFMTPECQLKLALASGGVPRDYLNIFAEAASAPTNRGAVRRLTPRDMFRAAAAERYASKLANLREDVGQDSRPLERLFADLLEFCLRERRKTAFLVSQDESKDDPDGNDLVQQLMDLKFIHLVAANISAASGRAGRFAAYTLDFAAFMEPRRRNIEIVEFWREDEQHRPLGIREAPAYSLSRARSAAEGVGDVDVVAVAESIDSELGFEASHDES